jgi:hypothetical protein
MNIYIVLLLKFGAFALASLIDHPNFNMPLEEAKSRLDIMHKQASNSILENLDIEEKAARSHGETPNCTRSNIALRQEL